MKSNYKNILIVRTDRIGDLVLTLPLAGLIKKHLPDSKVTFLVQDYTQNIAASNHFIDEVITIKTINGKISFNENLKLIKSKKIDACIVVYPQFLLSLILFFSGIKKRIGTGYRWYSFLFNSKVYEHRKYAEKHELEFNVTLLKQIGIEAEVTQEDVKYNLDVDDNALNNVRRLFQEHSVNLSEQIIIVHPGSGGSSADLPVQKFNDLVAKLKVDAYTVILTGTKTEINICENISKNNNAINLAGKLSISELTALISLSTMFISNSTGPLHIASALGKFIVGFYPRVVSCSKERWGPYTKNKLIYEPKLNCSNCTLTKCKELNCMDSIEIDEVYNDIKNTLNKLQEK